MTERLDDYLTPLRQNFSVRAFAAELERAEHRLLLLDYDGTLAAFVPAERRNEARPRPGVSAALNRVLAAQTQNRVVIVSARAVAEVEALLSDVKPLPEIWGVYGWERRDAGGRYHPPQPDDPQTEEALERVIAWAGAEALEYEIKPHRSSPVAVALHWNIGDRDPLGRSVEALEQMITAYTDAVAQESILRVEHGSRVRELIIPGKGKGTVVRSLLAGARREFPQGFLAAYFGDSRGDAEALDAIHEARAGIGVLVNNGRNARSVSTGEMAADVWLEDPDRHLANVLNFWA